MQATESLTIHRPQAEVWKLVGDPAQWSRWSKTFELVETHGPLRAGTRISYKYRGRPVEATIDPFIEGQVYGVRSVEKSYIFNESISLRSEGDSTVATFTMGFKPTALWARSLAVLIWPAKKLVLGRPLQKSLKSLRAVAESE